MTKLDNDQMDKISGGTPGNEDLDDTPNVGSMKDSRQGGDTGSGGGGGTDTPGGGGGGIGDTPQNEELG